MTPPQPVSENAVLFGEPLDGRVGPLEPPEATGTVAVPYDPARTRENFRGLIALILIGLMAAVIVATFALFWLHPDRAASLKDLFALIFGPVVALVGTATGFYFGSQSAKRG